MLTWIQGIDETVLRGIAEHLRVTWLDPIMVGITNLGNHGLLFILAALILVIFCKTRRSGASALTAMALGVLVTNLTIKPLVTRPRPWVAMDDFVPLVTSSDLNSFPSGHTTAAFAFAIALVLTLPNKWAKAAALIAAALMGFSRLYVGVHFPTDVLAGMVIGIVCGIVGQWLVRLVMNRWDGRRDT